MKKTLLLTACWIVAACVSLYAQSSTLIPVFKPVPASPEAYSIGKYGDVPVGLYNGVPDISIPIYTLTTKGVSVPITLGYHAGGIKVDELASNVGLGWTLNFGGAITSSVNGLPDEVAGGWLNATQRLPQSGIIQDSWGPFDSYDTDTTYTFLKGAAEGIIDTQPDIYYVNMNGRSFKYYFAQNNDLFMIPYQRLKFLTSRVIVDENDTKYTFDTEEISETSYTNTSGSGSLGSPTFSNSTYYLTQIVTAHKDTISYEYESYSYTFANQVSETRFALYPNQFGCAGNQPSPRVTESNTNITGQRIKKIKSNNGIEITFTYGLSRNDLPDTDALTAIEVKNTHSNTVICSYELGYDYYDSGAGTTPDDYRLKLLSVQKAGDNPYEFEYNTQALPTRLSFSQDHWGYYNGGSNTTMLPQNITYGFNTGANREASEYHALSGVLTKITYPTMGYSEFEYESNKDGSVLFGGIRVKSIEDHPITGNSKTKHYVYLGIAGSTSLTPEYVYVHNEEGYDIGQTHFDCLFYAQNSSSLAPLGVKGGVVGYAGVKVYTEDQTKGYTIHTFSQFGGTSGNQGYPFPPVISYDWVDGLPIETADYIWDATNSVYRPVKRVINDYKTDYGTMNGNLSNPHEYMHRGAKVSLRIPPIPPSFGGPTPRGPEFTVFFYNMYSSWSYPIKTTEMLYDPADTNKKVTTITRMYYDNPAHINVTRQEITRSNAEKYNILMRYPLDYNSLYPYNASPVVEKRIMINDGSADVLVDAELTTYLSQAGSFPDEYYNLNITDPVSPSSIALYAGSSIDANYEKRREYVYDADGNVISFISDGVIPVSIKWAYRKQYPVAEVKNALDTEFYAENFEESGTVNGTAHTGTKVYVGSTFTPGWTPPNGRTYMVSYWKRNSGTWTWSGLVSYTGSSHALSGGDAYDDIRIYPADAQITTYTYEPFVGMTSMTDAKGMVTYYEYDTYQRLKQVKDQNGNVLKTYQYHFKQ